MKKVIIWFVIISVVSAMMVFNFGCKEEVTPSEEVETTGEKTEEVAEEPETTDEEAEETVVAEGEERYVMITNLSAHPFWTEIKQGAQDAADQLGVSFEYAGPTEWDALAQADTVRQISITEPDGMLIGAYDPSMTTAIDEAWDKGIPVITFDGDAPDSKRVCFIGVKLYDYGWGYGKYIAQLLNNEGEIGVLTVEAQTNLQEKFDGMKDYLTENAPDIEIVAIEDNGGDDQVTADKTKAIIQSNPDIDGIVCLNATGSGIATALNELGKAGEIKVLSSDVSDPIMHGILDGAIDATTSLPIYLEGYYGLKFLYDYNHKNANVPGSDVGSPLLPTFVDVGYFFITAENAENFIVGE